MKKNLKRNIVMAAVLLFVCAAVYLNWSYNNRQGAALGQELDRALIEQRMEAYILDKARTLGVPLAAARVHLRWSTQGVWLPESAELTGTYNEILARTLEAELGIARSAQTWRTDEGP